MCFSKRVRASDALILSLSSFRDIVQAVCALSASSSYLRLLGQDILASTEDCIPTKQLLYLPARSQVQSYPASPVPQFPINPFRLSPSDPARSAHSLDGYCATLPPSEGRKWRTCLAS